MGGGALMKIYSFMSPKKVILNLKRLKIYLETSDLSSIISNKPIANDICEIQVAYFLLTLLPQNAYFHLVDLVTLPLPPLLALPAYNQELAFYIIGSMQ